MHNRIDKLSPHHEGIMPIRVLQHNLTHAFENMNPDFLALVQKLKNEIGLDTGIRYDCEPNKAESPYASSVLLKKIYIQETFLSYVWCVCFSLTVLYQESVVKQARNHINGNDDEKIDFPLARAAYKLYEYAMGLIHRYSDWTYDLPNPEQVEPHLDELISKVNSLYITAMKFILAHEFAHIELEHGARVASGISEEEHNIMLEKEADARALELVLAGVNDENEVTIYIGVLMGLCSLLFFNSSTKSEDHPDTDERIDFFMQKINPEVQDAMWGIATLAYKLWDNRYQLNLDWKHGLDSPKHLYDYIKAQVKNSSI